MRIDVDYPHTSRIRSFMYTVLGIRVGRDYLRNAKIIAEMINESSREVKVYWFFTPKTIPDKELLELLGKDKHEVALHIVNNPYKELKLMKKATGREINYYTIHGTARLLARIMWKRWRAKAPKIPTEFPLESFHERPTTGLDSLCYSHTVNQALKIAEGRIREGDVIYFHPIWLFQRGKLNRRGSFYEVLRWILNG